MESPGPWRVCGAHHVARPGRDARAVLEGVAFNLKMILDAFLEQGAVIQAMRLIAGGVGVGLFPDFGMAHEIVQVEEGERPNAAAQARYAELYPLFQETYRALEPIYERLGKK